MSVGRGYGKVILFNEHFVVHGVPAIVSGIADYTEVTVSAPGGAGAEDKPAGKGIVIKDDRKATAGYKKEKRHAQADSLKHILKAMNIDPKTDLYIKLGGPLYAASGVGASAASCAALVRALGEHFNLNLTDEQVNEYAYEGEKGYHGTPSGIDNTAATYGGLLWFEKTGGAPKIEKISLKEPVEIVMCDTGIVADTKAAVEGVKERKKADPEKYDRIFASALDLANLARAAITEFDMEKVGALMIENHKLLQAIEVSHEKLDYLVELAMSDGALGAKLTGGGLGGYMVALTPGKALQKKVAASMKADGYKVLKTTIQ